MEEPGGAEPIDRALVRASARRKLFGKAEAVMLSRFVVERRLGAGGMGVVYEARDPELGRKVAIKLLHEAGDAERLRGEARALARLRHPNVVLVHDVGTWNGHVFLTMEHVQGGTLRAWLRASPRSWRDIARVLACAARALAAAHAAGLVHRDVKPENVLVSDAGEVRVADFGLARPAPWNTGEIGCPPPAALRASAPPKSPAPPAQGGDRPRSAGGAPESAPASRPSSGAAEDHLGAPLENAPRSRPGSGTAAAGTPDYMAPECRAGAAGDARSDQYAFCVTVFEAFWGERPAAGATPPATRGVPRALRRAVARGLAEDPAARHSSMDPLVAALEADPRRTVRIVAGAGVIAAAVAALAVGLSRTAVQAKDADPCGHGAERVASVWSAERRAAVERAFDASKLPYAKKGFETAAARLDAYVAAWTAGHRDSCEATNVRHDQSAAVLDLRTRCLEQRRAALVRTIDLLAGGGADVVERSEAIVETLPPVEGCADVPALTAPVAPPSDPAAQQRLGDLTARLDEPITLAAALRFDQAIERGTALVADARALGYRPFLADALLALGIAQARGRRRECEQTFNDALLEAQASGHDTVVARAALKLTSLHSPTASAKAHEWARLADATLARLGRPAALTAEYEATIGHLLDEDAKYAEALPHLEAAVAASERAGQSGQLLQADYVNDLAVALDLAGQGDRARAQFEASFALYERILGKQHPHVARTLLNMAISEAGQVPWDTTLAHAEAASAILVALGTEQSVLGAQSLSHQATSLMTLDRPDEALARSRRALDILDKLHADDLTLLPLLHTQAYLLRDADRPSEALPLYERELSIRVRFHGAEHPSIGVPLIGSGESHLALGKPAIALPLCDRAASIMAKALGPEDTDLAPSISCAGRAQIALGQRQKGIATLERSVALLQKAGPDTNWLPEARIALARALWDAKPDRPRALALARAALAGFTKTRDERMRRKTKAWLDERDR